MRLWSLASDVDLAAGAPPRVRRLQPVFMEQNRPTLVRLPPAGAPDTRAASAPPASEASPAPAPTSPAHRCTTLVFLAPRTADFTVETEILPENDEILEQLLRQVRRGPPEHRSRSVAGAVRIERCDEDRDRLRFAVLQTESARATVEVILAESVTPPGPLEGVFPERVFGPVAPSGDPGRPTEPGPLTERVQRAMRRGRTEGAARVTLTETIASIDGTGEVSIRLSEGCHRLEIMADIPPMLPRRATDLDADVREVAPPRGAPRLIDRDRGEAADALLLACVGESTPVEIPFAGAAGPVRVLVSDASFPVPKGVPAHLGARARAGFAAALMRWNIPAPDAPPIHEATGVSGETMIPVPVEPGRCYFAAVSMARGDSRVLRPSIEIEGRVLRDDAVRSDSAGVTFCATTDERAVARVLAVGASTWWALSVWRMR